MHRGAQRGVAAPTGLSYDRHVSLVGRGAHPVARRVLLAVLGVIVVLALLDTFGQHPSTSRASGAFATLEVQSPHSCEAA